MDNKKKVIIAALLFIFLGLTVFTFANPDEEENNLDGGNNITETDKNVETDNDDVDDNQNQENEENTNNVANINNDDNDDTTNNGTTNPEQPIEEDNSYENALNAVINAETLIDEESYETAVELVELVTEETSKEELTNRLEEVKKGIDLKALVSTLETKTNTAADKTDMDAARNYRVDEDIVNLVTALTNETLKENLQSRLAVVAVLLDDTSLEVGIEDGAVFNTPTTIQIEDDNEITITLTSEEETKTIENGTTLTDGVYTLRVVDTAFNTATVTFTVDTTAPAINLPGTAGVNKNELHVESGTEITYEDLIATVVDDNADATVAPYEAKLLISDVASENTYGITDFTNGLDTNYVGRYNIEYTVTDKAGHTTTATMLLVMTDTVAPVINLPGTEGLNKNELRVESGTEIAYEDLLATVVDATADKTIAPYEAKLLISDVASENTYGITDFTNGLSTNYVGRYNIEYSVTDKGGNTTTATMLLVMTDTVAPVIILPGTEGLNKNELRVESGTEITYEDLLATVVDATTDATLAPYEAKLLISDVASENTYGITDFTNGLSTNYVGRYNIEYSVTDKAGHTTTATMLLVMTDTVAPVINLPGTEGLNKNELRVAAGTKITYEDLLATVVDATTDATLAPYEAKLLISDVASENTYGITDFTNGLSTNYVGRYNIEYSVTDKAGHTTTATMLLVMTDVKKPIVFGINKDRIYAKVNVTFKDDTAVTATIDGNPYELGTDYAVEGSHMLVVTDAAGNYTRVPFIIDPTPANVDENGNSVLDKDIILVDQPFYNVIDNTMPITIDGNNKTVTQIITKAELFNWIGTRPTMANMFATTTDTGKLITIKNITFAGTTQSISLGRYYDSNSNVYNTMLDNVTIKGLNVVSYSGDKDRKIMFAPAVITFGTTTIKNTTITGTKLSSYDDAYLYEEGYTDANGWIYQLTDLAAVNYSNTTIENSEVGKIWLWAKAKMKIENSKVDEIPFTPNTIGGLTIKGSTVNKITVTNFVSKPSLTVDNSTIEVLDVTQARSHKYITITNSTINKVLTAEGEMTLAQYQEWKQTH